MNSIKLFRVFGIPIELHSSFIWLILIGLLAFVFFPESFFSEISFIQLLVFLLLIYLSVLLHELSHSFVALSKGVKIEKIVLLPIGGIAFTKNEAKKPLDEFLIAVAGPLFNFFMLFGILLIVSINSNNPFWPYELINQILEGVTPSTELFENALFNYPLFTFFWINFMLGMFNLIPALPMDGGRILRSFLASFMNFNKATLISSKISRFIAIMMFVTAFLIGHLFLGLIALFVFFASINESSVVKIKEVFGSKSIEAIISENPLIIEGITPVMEVINLMNEKNLDAVLIHSDSGFKEFNSKSFPNKSINLSKPVQDFSFSVPLAKINSKAQKIHSYFMNSNANIIPVITKEGKIASITAIELKKYFNLLELNKKISK